MPVTSRWSEVGRTYGYLWLMGRGKTRSHLINAICWQTTRLSEYGVQDECKRNVERWLTSELSIRAWCSECTNSARSYGIIWKSIPMVQFSSVAQSCPTLCNPMNCSTPGLPVHHQLLEFTQTHVRWVSDPTIQPSHPLSSPFSSCLQSFPASGSFLMSQLFASGGHSIGVLDSTSVLPMNTQDWPPLGWTGWISLLSKGLSRVFTNTTVQKHPFFGAQLSLQSNSHIPTWPLEKP